MTTPIGHVISTQGEILPLFVSCPGRLPVSLVLTLLDLWTVRPPPVASQPSPREVQLTLVVGIERLNDCECCVN